MHRREAPRAFRPRRSVALGLGAVLTFTVLGLTQCRLVDDRITGVDLNAPAGLNARGDCVRQCSERLKECLRNEGQLHRVNLEACVQLQAADEREACKSVERVRHESARSDCIDEMKACKNACYNEGAGSLGS